MYNEFDTRMKSYENCNKLFLQKNTPVIIRIDGRAFHTYVRGLDRPFDDTLNKVMAETTEYLLNNISGCTFAYTQSDEISLLLVDYQKENTEPWFDNNQQKLVSISASITTLTFNRLWEANISKLQAAYNEAIENGNKILQLEDKIKLLESKSFKASFDSRAFNIPKEEVLNYFIWRQKDCTKNSISMLAQAHFSHKELQGKSGSDKQDMLMTQKNINWNNLPTKFKRGVSVYKTTRVANPDDVIRCLSDIIVVRDKSFIDYEMPILTQDREFIKDY